MITVFFTQCSVLMKQDWLSLFAANLPLNKRVLFYEEQLLARPDHVWKTLDEHLLLIAQHLKRNRLIQFNSAVSVCDCKGYVEQPLHVDDEGDLTGEPHHGLFRHRMRYLR